jgi:glucose-6-phosphate isomerase
MIELSFDGLMKGVVKDSLNLNKTQIYSNTNDSYLDKIKKRGQGFYDVIDDSGMIEQILKYSDSVRWRFQTIVVLGIGGSALGSICINSALGGVYSPAKGKPRLYVLDNIDPVLLSEFEHKVELKKTLFVVVTKSGGTPETMAQFLYFKKRVEQAKLPLEEHFVFITDPKKVLSLF